MKKIRGLNNIVVDFSGKPYTSKETCKDVIMSVLYNSKSESKEAIRIVTKLLPMLQAGKASVEFEDADYEIIKSVVESNQVGMSNGLLGQILSCFEEE